MIGLPLLWPPATGAFNQRSFRSCRVNHSPDCGDPIRGEASPSRVFPDGRLVRSEVDAVNLVAGYVAVQPLDLGTHCLQNADRFLRDFLQLGVGKFPGSRNFAFDDEFGHRHTPDALIC